MPSYFAGPYYASYSHRPAPAPGGEGDDRFPRYPVVTGPARHPGMAPGGRDSHAPPPDGVGRTLLGVTLVGAGIATLVWWWTRPTPAPAPILASTPVPRPSNPSTSVAPGLDADAGTGGTRGPGGGTTWT